jgi:hypothetical protein
VKCFEQFFAVIAVFAPFASGCLRFEPAVREQQQLDGKGAEFAKDAENGNGYCLELEKRFRWRTLRTGR